VNEKELRQDLISWMTDFVEKPNSLLGDWAPCPYARQARQKNKIDIQFAEPKLLHWTIRKNLPNLETFDAIIIALDHNLVDATDLATLCNDWNENWLMPKDYVVLEDHPHVEENVNGVHMNFGKCALVILQKLSKLNEASTKLKEKGYYDQWSEDDLNFVVNWRVNK